MIRKVQLVNAPMDDAYVRSIRSATYPPVGLASIAASVAVQLPWIEVEILDGELLSTAEIIRRLDGDVVGVSANIMTYGPALEIARAASWLGARVLMGGPYVGPMAQKILAKRPFIDAVGVGDGEPLLVSYLAGLDAWNIPGLVHRDGTKVVANREEPEDLDSLYLPDYSSLPVEDYFDTYRRRYSGFKPYRGSLPVYSRKGCKWRTKSGGCVFCMVPHGGLRLRRPDRVWDEISTLHRLYGADHFWEVSDTFTEDDRWIEEFIRCRPKGLDVAFQIYGRPNHLTARMASRLADLNVNEVFIGAESADDGLLKAAVKGCRRSHTERAVEVLGAEGIRTIVSFVFGLPGETVETLQRTVEFAHELAEHENVIETSSSVLLPIPGSPAFSQLLTIEGMPAKHNSDLLDLEALKKDWAHHFTHVEYDDLVSAREKTVSMFALNSTFSQIGLQAAPTC